MPDSPLYPQLILLAVTRSPELPILHRSLSMWKVAWSTVIPSRGNHEPVCFFYSTKYVMNPSGQKPSGIFSVPCFPSRLM